MLRSDRRFLIPAVTLAWLVLVASLYYVVHKPFSPALAAQFSSAIGQTLAAAALISVSGGLGARLLPDLRLRPLAGLALQAALGLGLLSLGVLVCGAGLGISPTLAWGGLLLLVALLGRSVLSWWRSWGDLPGLWRESDPLGKAIAAGAGLSLLLTWATALAPPLKFDALVYHLALPRAYLATGKILYVPDNMFWGMPQVGEMMYTWAAALAGMQAAPVLGWGVAGLALAGLAGLLSQPLGPRAAWVAVASLLAGYSLAASPAWGYVDWFTVLFGLGFLAAVVNWRAEVEGIPGRNSPADRMLILAGVFAGLALGTKYTAGILLLAGPGMVIWSLPSHPARRILAALLRFGLPAVAVSLPWWIKNYLATGNPFYPFFFPSGAMSSFRLDFYGIPAWGDWQDLAFLPWRATWLGVEGGAGYSASIGPLLLGLAPLGWLGWKLRPRDQRAMISTAGIAALAGLLAWAVAARLSGYLIQSRLYWAIFPALAVLAGAGFQALDGLTLPGLRIGRVAGALVLLVFGFSILQLGVTTVEQGGLQVLLSLQTEEDYQAGNLGWYAPAARAVQALPSSARVLMLWEPRSLYCAPQCQPDEVLDRWLRELHVGQDTERLAGSWQREGYTHLLYNRFGAGFVRQNDPRYRGEDWQALDSLLAGLPAPRDFGGAYQLYSLGP